MASKSLAVSVHVTGVRQTLAAFARLPKEASDDLRTETLKLSESLARKVADAARIDSDQAALIAPTVKAVRDRIPAITAGGTKRVGRNRVPAYRILFGSEFGARRRFGWYAQRQYAHSAGRQYRRHLGKGSYWFFQAVEDATPDISTAWSKVADDIVTAWSRDA